MFDHLHFYDPRRIEIECPGKCRDNIVALAREGMRCAPTHHKMTKYNKNKFNTTFALGIRKRRILVSSLLVQGPKTIKGQPKYFQ